MNAVIQGLVDAVARAKEVDESAIVLINGFAAAQQAAIDKALENGATAEQLQPLTDNLEAFKAETQSLADAVVANTPAQ